MKRFATLIAAMAVVAAACGGSGGDSDAGEEPAITGAGESTVTRDPATTTSAPAAPEVTIIDEGDPANVALPVQLSGVATVWPTNWARRSIDLDELQVGLNALDPRDLIRPIDEPIYEDVASADAWLEDPEPGIFVEVAGESIFYPIRILTAHEIVNDQRGDVPFALTYCPLCNSAAAFDRRVDGQVLRFGVSGLLRHSDLVMWDDATVSLWQQITGTAIVGEMTGTQLEFLPAAIVRWADFKSEHPEGDVLSQESGPFNYGSNGYVGYSSRSAPFRPFFTGEVDDRFEALSRVVGVRVGDLTKAYPFETIAEERVVNDELGGVPLVVLWGASDTADPLDAPVIAQGEAIGTGIAFDRRVDGQVLTFSAVDDTTFMDAETGSTWSILGTAVDGPLAGTTLDPIIHLNEFWFAWAAFNEGSPVYGSN